MVNLSEDDVRVVIWHDVTLVSVMDVLASMRSQHLRCGRRPLLYLGVVPEEAPSPDAEVRKALAHGMKEVSGMCDYLGLLLQGNGLKAAAKRSAFSALLMMAMKGKWHVAAGIGELIGRSAGDPRRVKQLRCAGRLAAEKGCSL